MYTYIPYIHTHTPLYGRTRTYVSMYTQTHTHTQFSAMSIGKTSVQICEISQISKHIYAHIHLYHVYYSVLMVYMAKTCNIH